MVEPPEAADAYLQRHGREIAAAARRIAPYIRRTPTLSTDLGPSLRLKPECFQLTGSFKVRGAFNAVLRLKQDHPETEGVIAVSSGNHAQALALAARTAGFRAVILIPQDANPVKVAATRAFGAEVIQDGITSANRDDRLRDVMAGRRLTLVHPFDDWDVIHGQGTAAAELLEDVPKIGTLVTPCGGGGLLSGTALSAKASNPAIRVIGVEPERAADAAQTVRTKSMQRLSEPPATLADGVRTTSIGLRSFEVMVERGLVEDVVTVSEEEIASATRTAWLELKLALEPTGALALAAYMAGKLGGVRGGTCTGLILTGGNADPAVVARLLTS